jgi:hypothetical protein
MFFCVAGVRGSYAPAYFCVAGVRGSYAPTLFSAATTGILLEIIFYRHFVPAGTYIRRLFRITKYVFMAYGSRLGYHF